MQSRPGHRSRCAFSKIDPAAWANFRRFARRLRIPTSEALDGGTQFTLAGLSLRRLARGQRSATRRAHAELTQWYGTIDDISDIVPFTFTEFYKDEMGENLLRQWVRFEPLFSPEHLAKCKLETNMAETLLARQFSDREAKVRRPINIDPGYVHRYKVVLATTKDHSHRVYMREGIYSEVTLHWSQNRWTPWPWTYADYRTEQATVFFERARAAYLAQLQRIAGVH